MGDVFTGFAGFIPPSLLNCLIEASKVDYAVKNEAERNGLDGVVAVLAVKKGKGEVPDAKTLMETYGSVAPIYVAIGEAVIFQTDEDADDENHFGIAGEKVAKLLRTKSGKSQEKNSKEILGENKFESGCKIFTSEKYVFYVGLSTNDPSINDCILDDAVISTLGYSPEE